MGRSTTATAAGAAIVRLNVFAFTDYRVFLNSYFVDQKRRWPAFSTRYWCNKLELKSTATLNMVLRGRRHPGEQMLERLLRYFAFDQRERHYFEQLIRYAKCRSDSPRKGDLLADLSHLHPQKSVAVVDFAQFSAIANWHYFAIRELVKLPDFDPTPRWIARRLRGKVKVKQVEQALGDLERLGLLQRDQLGRLAPTDKDIATPNDVANEAIKRFHEQSLDLARAAIRDVPIERRHVSGVTFNIRQADLPALKRELFDLQLQLFRKYERQDGDDTYQLNVQLFPLSDSDTTKDPNEEV